jgi:hypothetical protein
MHLALKIPPALMALVLIGTSCTTYGHEPVARAVQFLTNVHTGKMMKADEWLTRKARLEPAFNAHGGLNAMVKQSTARAERYGGLKTVEVLQVTKTTERVDVKIRVNFKQDPGSSLSGAPSAPKEEMIWDITAMEEDGNWKLSF